MDIIKRPVKAHSDLEEVLGDGPLHISQAAEAALTDADAQLAALQKTGSPIFAEVSVGRASEDGGALPSSYFCMLGGGNYTTSGEALYLSGQNSTVSFGGDLVIRAGTGLLGDGVVQFVGDWFLFGTDITGMDTSTVSGSPNKLVTSEAIAASIAAAGSGSPSGTASGDLSGTYPGPTVAKIQNVPIADTAPTDGQILAYNLSNDAWQPEDFGRAIGISTTNITTSGTYSADFDDAGYQKITSSNVITITLETAGRSATITKELNILLSPVDDLTIVYPAGIKTLNAEVLPAFVEGGTELLIAVSSSGANDADTTWAAGVLATV